MFNNPMHGLKIVGMSSGVRAGTPNSKLVGGGLAPGFPNYWGGKMPPKSQILGAKILKIPTYLVLKGRKIFSTSLKTRSLDVS